MKGDSKARFGPVTAYKQLHRLGVSSAESKPKICSWRQKAFLEPKSAGAFLDPDKLEERRGLEGFSLDDFDLPLYLTRADPFCDRIEWTYAVAISDAT